MPPEIVQALIAQGMPLEEAMMAAYAPSQGLPVPTAGPVPGLPVSSGGAPTMGMGPAAGISGMGGGVNLDPPPAPGPSPEMMMMGGQMGPGATPTPAVAGFASTDPQGIAEAVMSRFAEMADEDMVDLQERQQAAVQTAPAIVEALIRQAEEEARMKSTQSPYDAMGEGAAPMLPPGMPMGRQ